LGKSRGVYVGVVKKQQNLDSSLDSSSLSSYCSYDWVDDYLEECPSVFEGAMFFGLSVLLLVGVCTIGPTNTFHMMINVFATLITVWIVSD